MKLKNPDYSRMYDVVKAGFEKSLGRVLLAILTYIMLKIFMTWIFSSPLQHMLERQDGEISLVRNFALAGTVFFAAEIFLGILTFGLISFITDFLLKKQSVPATLLCGLKMPKVWQFSALHAVISVAALAAVSAFFIFKGKEILAIDFPKIENVDEKVSRVVFSSLLMSLLYVVLHFIVSIPFVFTWNILRDNPGARVLQSFARSFTFFIPRFFHYLGFVIYICLKNAVFYVVLMVLNLTVNLGFFSLVIFFFSFMQMLIIVLKAYAAIPVYWYSLLSVNDMVDSSVEVNSGDES